MEGNVSTLETELAASEAEVTRLDGELTAAESEVTRLDGELTAAEAEVSILEANLVAAEAQVSTLSEELKIVKDPRHFESLEELTDWLEQDDTDTRYADKESMQRSFILQVRALRDGYILSATVFEIDGAMYLVTQAVIGGNIYWVNSANDYIILFDVGYPPQPSHPLPLD